jgi:hypothetical protein
MSVEKYNSMRWKIIRNCLMMNLVHVQNINLGTVAIEFNLTECRVKVLIKQITKEGIDTESIKALAKKFK